MFYLYLAICASLLSSKWAWRVNIICLPWLKISILVLGEEEELKWLSWFVFSFLGSPKQSSNIGRRGMESRYDMSQMGFLSCFFLSSPYFILSIQGSSMICFSCTTPSTAWSFASIELGEPCSTDFGRKKKPDGNKAKTRWKQKLLLMMAKTRLRRGKPNSLGMVILGLLQRACKGKKQAEKREVADFSFESNKAPFRCWNWAKIWNWSIPIPKSLFG